MPYSGKARSGRDRDREPGVGGVGDGLGAGPLLRGDAVKVPVSERALRDKERYHRADPMKYASSIGMPYQDANGDWLYACVGCWWCEPETVDLEAA
jgi:hypothetical protein